MGRGGGAVDIFLTLPVGGGILGGGGKLRVGVLDLSDMGDRGGARGRPSIEIGERARGVGSPSTGATPPKVSPDSRLFLLLREPAGGGALRKS